MVLWVRLCAARAGLGALPSGGFSTTADFRRAYLMGIDAKIWCENVQATGLCSLFCDNL